MDRLVTYINENNKNGGELANVHIAYSTLSEYFDGVWAQAKGLPSGSVWGPTHPDAHRRTALEEAQVRANAGEVGEEEGAMSDAALWPFPVLDANAVDGGVDFFP